MKPKAARFQLFTQLPPKVATELESVLGLHAAKFDASEQEASCYQAAHVACQQRVEKVLQVRHPAPRR